MNHSNTLPRGDHSSLSIQESEVQQDSEILLQESRASVTLDELSPLSHLAVASQAASFSDPLSMRLVAQKQDLIGKLKQLSIAPHIFLRSYSERLCESMVIREKISGQHPFSDNFQEIFKVRSQESNTIRQKKVRALKEFLDYIKKSIQEKYSFLPIDQFNDRSNTKNLAVYLLERVDDEKMHYLIAELTYFYQSILDLENEAVVKVAFSIFPPHHPADFQCLEGTRERLYTAISYMKDHMCEPERMSLKSMLDQKISQAGESVIAHTIIKEKLRFLLHPSIEVHSKSFLSYLSGVSSHILEKKDSYYLTPLADFPASIAYDFLSNFRQNLNEYTTEYKKILIDQFENFFHEVNGFDNENSSLSDLSDHFFLQYIRSLDPDFDLMSEKYLIPKDEYYFSFTLNKEYVLFSVFSILEHQLSGGELKNESMISLLDAYDSNASDKIKFLILSDDLDEIISAINILYVLSERFKGNSPVRFISILLDIAPTLPDFDYDTAHTVNEFFSSLSGQFIFHPIYSSVKEKIEKISSRFEYYFSIPREQNDQFENLISYRMGKDYSSAGLFLEYLKGGGSLHEFQLLNTAIFNTEAKKINDLLFKSNSIIKFVFHPEFKELFKKFFPYFYKESIEKIMCYTIFLNQEDQFIDLIKDDFFKASIPCLDREKQAYVLHLVFKRKNYLLAGKLLEVGFDPMHYMHIYADVVINSSKSYQYNNLITLAVRDSRFSLLANLIEKGIDIHEMSLSEPYSLFKMAFDLDRIDLLNFLFEHGLKIEKINSDLRLNACHTVALNNLAHFIPVMLQQGFSVDHFMEQKGRGMTAVNIAAKKGCIEVIEKLLEASLPEEAFLESDIHSDSAFAHLMITNNLHAIEVLLKHGFSLDKLLTHQVGHSECQTLQYLALRGKLEIFQFFCSQIPRDQVSHYLSQKTPEGETLVHFAVKNIDKNTKKILELLSQYLTTDELIACNDEGRNLFHLLANLPSSHLTSEKMEVSVSLLRFLADFISPEHVNLLDQSGYAPAHIAALNENLSMVSALFDYFEPSKEVLEKKLAFYFWQRKLTLAEFAMNQGHIDLSRRITHLLGQPEVKADTCLIL